MYPRYARRVEFAILGPVEVRHDGDTVPVGGPKQRALLAMLLLADGTPVSRDALIEGLWGERPPATAGQTLDSYLSRLRRTLGSDRIERRPPGYALRVAPDELDRGRFERLVADAREDPDPRRAVTTLQEALGLWRGPALADLRCEPFADGVPEQLDGRRLAAVEDLFEARLELGEGAALTGELERAVADHPLNERLLHQLMLARYRAGRQADALDACQSARRRFAELGLELGPRVRELESRILRHDAALSPVVRGSRSAARRRRRGLRRLAIAAAAIAGAAGAGVALDFATQDGVPASLAAGEPRLVAITGGSHVAVAAVALTGPPAAVVAANGSLWVADPQTQAVERVDLASAAITDRVPVPGQPGSIAAGDGAVWVASTLGGTITRIDPATDDIVQTVRIPGATTGSLALRDGRLWAADTADDALIALDARTGARRGSYPLAFRPTFVAASRDAVWAASYDAGLVAEVDPRTGRTVQSIRVGNGPAALVAVGGALWVANNLDSTVSRIDPASGSVTATVPVASGPTALAASAGSLWVASQYAASVSRLDPRTGRQERTFAVGGQPTTLAAYARGVWVGTAAASRSHRGGTLVIDSAQRFSTVDPSLHFTAEPFQFGHLAYDGLVSFQETAGPTGLRLVPDLAVAVPAPAAGGTAYTFRLRRGVRYSNGRLVRASDFRRGIERLYRLGSLGASYFRGILGTRGCARAPRSCSLRRGIATNDAYGTVTFRLQAPDPDFPFRLAVLSYAVPVPPGTPDDDARLHPVPGTGPYRVTPWHGGSVRLVRNPYFREWSQAAQPAGNPDTIVWRFVDSNAAAVREVAAGKADWLLDVVSHRALRRFELRHPAQVKLNPSLVFDFAALNTHRAPFDHLAVRRALNLAVDRRRIVRLYGGPDVASPLCQALLPGLAGYRRYCPYTRNPRPDGRWAAPDLARARRLVAASGTRGQVVDVWGISNEISVPATVPAYVTGVLRSLGYRARLHLRPSNRISEPLRRTFQISVDGDWEVDYPSPSADVPQFFACGGGYTNGYVCDHVLDREIQRAIGLESAHPGTAAAAWRRVDRRITDQALWVPTVNVHEPEIVSARVRNYQFNPIWGFLADQVWLH
jgi:peptide/nickel transport system substrate-binding protein